MIETGSDHNLMPEQEVKATGRGAESNSRPAIRSNLKPIQKWFTGNDLFRTIEVMSVNLFFTFSFT